MQERGSLLWGVSQNEICIPSHWERASEERGLLEKEPLTLEAPGQWRRSERKEGVPIAFGSHGVCCSPRWLSSSSLPARSRLLQRPDVLPAAGGRTPSPASLPRLRGPPCLRLPFDRGGKKVMEGEKVRGWMCACDCVCKCC